MKVTFISHSDLLGGASVVTYRLMQALQRMGVDARMIVYTRTATDDPSITAVGSRFMRGVKFMAERAAIMAHRGITYANLFKVSTASVGYRVDRHPWVREADVICLAWINQGLLSLDAIRRLGALGKPIVWTMHDMWCMTGICHHALDCTRYRGECGECPYLGADIADDLSHRVWLRKQALYASVPVTFVAVSRWLARCAAQSRLLAGADVRVIHNAFPVDSFFTSAPHRVEHFNIDYSRALIVMGAARLDDTIKGLPLAIEALNYLFDNHPEVASRAQIVLFGELRQPALLDNLRFSHAWIGRVNDPQLLRVLYATASVVLSSSLYETLPGTLIEGQAAGALPVTFGRGGQEDIVTHLTDGYIARYPDTTDLARGIMWALEQTPDREEMHASVRRRFAASAIAARYVDLFRELLAAKQS